MDQPGFTINYAYDGAGRLSKLTDGGGGLIAQYAYDAVGLLAQQDDGNGTRTVTTYDAAGNVVSITNYAPNHTTVNSFDQYSYDTLGKVYSDTNRDGQWVYGYDDAGELTNALFTPNGSDPDRLAAQNLQYAYDAVGNRVSQTVNGTTTTYVSNSVNETTGSLTKGAATTYQYDADGNLTGQTAGGVTTTYAFNALNELTGVTGPGLAAAYFYDPLGNRVSQTVNGATTNFQIDPAGPGVVAAFGGSGVYNNGGGLLAHYTFGLGLTSQVDALRGRGVLRLRADGQHGRHHQRRGQLREHVQLPAVRPGDGRDGGAAEPVHVLRPVRRRAGRVRPVCDGGAGVRGGGGAVPVQRPAGPGRRRRPRPPLRGRQPGQRRGPRGDRHGLERGRHVLLHEPDARRSRDVSHRHAADAQARRDPLQQPVSEAVGNRPGERQRLDERHAQRRPRDGAVRHRDDRRD